MTDLSDLHVAVFTKPLVPGEVKTRLIPSLGAEGAVAMQRAMLQRTLTVATQVAAAQVSLWVAGDPGHPTLQHCPDAFGVSMRTQQDGDLGARMHSAMTRLLPEYACVLLVGCDCPALSAAHMQEAAQKLEDPGTDAVFTPVEDGGYALIGLSPRAGWQQRALDAVFSGIDWSTDRVMAQTRTQLARAGLGWAEQPMLWDVDRPEDVTRAQALGLSTEGLRNDDKSG